MEKCRIKLLLILDPDYSFRKGLVHGLKSIIPNIIECGNPFEARLALREKQVEMIITELCFPAYDGLKFVKECAADLPNIPIIVLSSYAAEMNHELKSIGISAVIEKPSTTKHIIETIIKR